MAKVIDYYFTPMSPWAYLGSQRFAAMAEKFGATVKVKPVDYGRIFPVSGGLPLPKRAPQRQAYRLVELKRWRDHLGVPLNVQPKHHPGPGEKPSFLIIAADRDRFDAMRLSHALMTAVWSQDRDLNDDATLIAIADECGMPGDRLLAASRDEKIKATFDAYTQEAIDRQVFGAPTYVVDGELFWGQDRLDFLERKLARA
ncbi:MAG: 2-hydroxychromene-2-carboxylate isomerase [Alphaproteobacteria bacterium]|nr:2-hydroxychromene-2-carboxylate isomerase [Alphaproteobacteria bacterium]